MTHYRFIGKDESMGLHHGNKYLIHVKGAGDHIDAEILLTEVQIKMPGIHAPFIPFIYCPYDNWDKFFENWEEIHD